LTNRDGRRSVRIGGGGKDRKINPNRFQTCREDRQRPEEDSVYRVLIAFVQGRLLITEGKGEPGNLGNSRQQYQPNYPV